MGLYDVKGQTQVSAAAGFGKGKRFSELKGNSYMWRYNVQQNKQIPECSVHHKEIFMYNTRSVFTDIQGLFTLRLKTSFN